MSAKRKTGRAARLAIITEYLAATSRLDRLAIASRARAIGVTLTLDAAAIFDGDEIWGGRRTRHLIVAQRPAPAS